MEADADISPQRFERHLRWLSRWRRVVTVEEMLRAHPSQNLVAITFDDGYRDNLTVALPLLEKFRLPMTLFVTAGFLGRDGYLSETELREISQHPLVTIGAHGLWHRHFNRLTQDEARFELMESRRLLGGVTGKTVDLLAWPYGECNSELEQLSAACGYRASWSVWKGTNSAHSRWRVPLGRRDNLARFIAKSSGVYSLTKARWHRLKGMNDNLECADLSALCPVATCRGRVSLESTQGAQRPVAAGQSADWSAHSKIFDA
jgi:peptidoglycan/xylan/chitin deacetylase (PgdA/CDA1 family)